MLDVACGSGRHALAAAQRGADVVAVDADGELLRGLERIAGQRRVTIETVEADLDTFEIAQGEFDAVLIFNYLNRSRMPTLLGAVRPGGYVLAETFLEEQRLQGWGPQSDEHLLKTGELTRMVDGFELILGREVIEVIDGRPAAIASVFAQRPPE